MKVTPDVPPMLLEIASAMRDLERSAADSLETQRALLQGESFAYAGDWHSDKFQQLRDEAARIARRLEDVSAELARAWTPK